MAQLERVILVQDRFCFPFETIEDVIIENGTTLTVFNDNNFPGSTGRNAKLADDNDYSDSFAKSFVLSSINKN